MLVCFFFFFFPGTSPDPNRPKSVVDLALERMQAGRRRKKDDLEESERADLCKSFVYRCIQVCNCHLTPIDT